MKLVGGEGWGVGLGVGVGAGHPCGKTSSLASSKVLEILQDFFFL